MKLIRKFDNKFDDPKMEQEYVAIRRMNVLKDFQATVFVVFVVTLTTVIDRSIKGDVDEVIIASSFIGGLVIIFFFQFIPICRRHIEYLSILVIFAYNVYRLIIMNSAYSTTIKASYFFGGYTYAILQMIMISRVPGNFWKLMVIVATYALRYAFIFAQIDSRAAQWGTVVRGAIVDLFILYYYYSNDKTDRKVFQNFYENREELKKFKELLADFPQSVTVAECLTSKQLFSNTTFVNTFEKSADGRDQSNGDSPLLQNTQATIATARPYLNSLRVDEATIRETGSLHSTLKLATFRNPYPSLIEVLSALNQETILNTKTLSCTATLPLQDQEDKNRSFEVILKKMKWDRVDAIAVILIDITYQEKIIALKSAMTNKDKIIATVSHELRTPLNGIVGLLDMAQKKVTHPEALKYISLSKDNVHLLLSLVNSHLDLQMISAGKLRLNPSTCDLSKVLNDITQLLQFHTSQKGIYLQSHIDNQAPKNVVTDENRLKQILINLVGNAIKFTSTGGITIEIAQDPHNPMCLRVSVIDTGIGIKDEDKGKLFQMYGRLEEGRNVNKTGVGLGLTISNALALLLSGQTSTGKGIEVESETGVGSNFYFKILKDLGEVADAEDQKNKTGKYAIEGSRPDVSRANTGRVPKDLALERAHSQNKIHFYKMQDQGNNNVPSEFEDEPSSPVDMYAKLASYMNIKRINLHDLNSKSKVYKSSNGESSPLDARDSGGFGAPTNYPTDSQRNNREATVKPDDIKLKLEAILDPKDNKDNVLIVDDNPFNLLVTSSLLKEMGYIARTAMGGQEAIDIAKSLKQEGKLLKAILMDCLMPEMDGYEASTRLRALMKENLVQTVPILALTAKNNDEEEAKKCYESGMEGYLTKPVTPDVLKEAFSKLA